MLQWNCFFSSTHGIFVLYAFFSLALSLCRNFFLIRNFLHLLDFQCAVWQWQLVCFLNLYFFICIMYFIYTLYVRYIRVSVYIHTPIYYEFVTLVARIFHPANKQRKREKGKWRSKRSKRITKSNRTDRSTRKKVESSGNEWRGKNDGGNLIFHKLKINQKWRQQCQYEMTTERKTSGIHINISIY